MPRPCLNGVGVLGSRCRPPMAFSIVDRFCVHGNVRCLFLACDVMKLLETASLVGCQHPMPCPPGGMTRDWERDEMQLEALVAGLALP